MHENQAVGEGLLERGRRKHRLLLATTVVEQVVGRQEPAPAEREEPAPEAPPGPKNQVVLTKPVRSGGDQEGNVWLAAAGTTSTVATPATAL